MVSDDEKNIAMIGAVSEVLRLRKIRKNASHEVILEEMDDFIHKAKEKDLRLMMIIAASKTLDFLERYPNLSDKEIMKKMVNDFSSFIENTKH